jgi:hypothetical protein
MKKFGRRRLGHDKAMAESGGAAQKHASADPGSFTRLIGQGLD